MHQKIEALPIALSRESFIQQLLRHLAGALQDVVGLGETEGFVSLVGQKMGEELDQRYRNALHLDRLEREQIASVLVDLKRRIEGDFYIIEETEEKIVLGNRACPFGDYVLDRPALCMMTSNVFGVIAAENLGYARVSIDEAIATGSPQCRVTIYLNADGADEGREYYATS
ncbi:methanogen output domain 1-containing protein [Algiphilus sp.]|uniref:methanogen output domain 1-containing protein n=1 Tax=Algiphilus sp. TaxID=1872431 RepID=UPI003BAAEF09